MSKSSSKQKLQAQTIDNLLLSFTILMVIYAILLSIGYFFVPGPEILILFIALALHVMWLMIKRTITLKDDIAWLA